MRKERNKESELTLLILIKTLGTIGVGYLSFTYLGVWLGILVMGVTFLISWGRIILSIATLHLVLGCERDSEWAKTLSKFSGDDDLDTFKEKCKRLYKLDSKWNILVIILAVPFSLYGGFWLGLAFCVVSCIALLVSLMAYYFSLSKVCKEAHEE